MADRPRRSDTHPRRARLGSGAVGGIAPATAAILAALAVLAAGGCGDSDGDTKPLAAASDPDVEELPRPAPGETLERFAAGIDATPGRLELATSVHTTGHSRIAFAVTRDGEPVYGPTALYASPLRASPPEVAGPLPAPADRLPGPHDGPAAVYEAAAVDTHHTGPHDLLALTQTGTELIAARTRIDVIHRRRDPLPTLGKPLPDRATLPHRARAAPAALVFEAPNRCAPAFCASPIAAAARLERRYGDRVTFVDGDSDLARTLALTAAPWVIALDADGRVAARMEGAIGLAAFERAIQAALARGG